MALLLTFRQVSKLGLSRHELVVGQRGTARDPAGRPSGVSLATRPFVARQIRPDELWGHTDTPQGGADSLRPACRLPGLLRPGAGQFIQPNQPCFFDRLSSDVISSRI